MTDESDRVATSAGTSFSERLARSFPLTTLLSGLSGASKRAMRFSISDNIYSKQFKSGVSLPIGETVKQARQLRQKAIAEEQNAQEDPDTVLSGVSDDAIALYLRNAVRSWSLMACVAISGWLFMGASLSTSFSVVSANRFTCGLLLMILGSLKAVAAARDAFILETRSVVALRDFLLQHTSRLCPYQAGSFPRRFWVVTGFVTAVFFLGWPALAALVSDS